MKLNLDRLERIPYNKERVEKAERLLNEYPNSSRMFKADIEYNSGDVYRLELIPYAGYLSDNCYVRFKDKSVMIYTFNGYLQEVCEIDYDGKMMNLINQSMPYEYYEPVIRYIKNSIFSK